MSRINKLVIAGILVLGMQAAMVRAEAEEAFNSAAFARAHEGAFDIANAPAPLFRDPVFNGATTEPPPWLDKNGKPIEWWAGLQYDLDLANAKAALADLAKIYPSYQGQGCEIAGFVWWQGHKDQSQVYASHYEQNLVNLIKSLRKDYNAPNVPFVLAVGCGNPGRESFGLQIAEAQLAMNDAKKHPEFAGNVKCVDSRVFWRDVAVSPKDQGYHYNRNAETCMEVGLSLGWAMADLLKDKE